MGIDHHKVAPALPLPREVSDKKGRAMPVIGIYRPPAARRLDTQESPASASSAERPRSKQRRPDLQVYVPRAKRASTDGRSTDKVLASSDNTSACHEVIDQPSKVEVPNPSVDIQTDGFCVNKSCSGIEHETLNKSHSTSKSDVIVNEVENVSLDSDHKPDELFISPPIVNPSSPPAITADAIVKEVEKQTEEVEVHSEVVGVHSEEVEVHSEELQVHSEEVEVHSEELQVHSEEVEVHSEELEVHSEEVEVHSEEVPVDVAMKELPVNISTEEEQCNHEQSYNNSISDIVIKVATASENVDFETTDIDISAKVVTEDLCRTAAQDITSDSGILDDSVGVNSVVVNSVVNDVSLIDKMRPVEIVAKERLEKCEDEEETCRIREDINRKNRSIHRGNISFISDLLVISDHETSSDLTAPVVTNSEDTLEEPSKGSTCKEIKATKSDAKSNTVRLNPDECTWDMMFDENGDCLDPLLMEELTSKVGQVTIKTPQSDYKQFVTREALPRDEYSHVIEIYNFPAEFKTQDLINVFSAYRNQGFEIKWVDDTHALGVFSSSVVAEEVLETSHPFVKVRPLHEATAESRTKARRSSEFLQPYRSRPETCPALARRMVTGALGVRLSTAKQEREAEKALLKVARDKKKLVARQKDEAWEGTLASSTPT